MAGYFFTHANISLYNSSDHTGNPDVEPLYVRYVDTVDVNDTVTDTIADLRSESASARCVAFQEARRGKGGGWLWGWAGLPVVKERATRCGCL